MRLLSLELRNIRSYRSQRIEFPQGITLLSGDIGAGKSTMLIAIEFALFGLSRGELVGTALLRHGASDGSVTLRFRAGGHEYAVSRTLRRTPAGVAQDNGFLETDHAREQLTPSELRAKIFELLGYPLQFLSKQKNLLYRFTIYTPQEEMKSILTQSSEERLETIRRIFSIDAYRTARDNAHLLAKSLRERETRNEALIARIAQDQERLRAKLATRDELVKQQGRFLEERARLAAILQQAEAAVAQAETLRAELQQQAQLQAMQERNRKLAESELARMREQLVRKEKLTQDARTTVEKLRAGLALYTKDLPADADTLPQRMADTQTQLEQLRQDEGRIIGILEQCRHAPGVAAGTKCPTCRQDVTSGYLDEVKATLAAQSAAAQKKQQAIAQRAAQARQQLEQLKAQQERVRQVADIRGRLQLQEQTLASYDEDLRLTREALAAKQAALSQMTVTVDAQLPERTRLAEQQLLERKTVLQRGRQQSLDVERQLARLEQEQKGIEQAAEQLTALEQESGRLQAELERDSRTRTWLSRQFTPFAANVERHVLLSIHAAFDAAFRQWFSRLIEDDAIGVRIDSEFSPVVIQNGYETDVAFLSGGERTSVSLAYRLALVHTIHLLSPDLGTAGLVMLDEPTEGFSSEQLERVRDVLRELAMEQIIVVSHEQQLEGFVDHILRVRKSGDGSSVEVTA